MLKKVIEILIYSLILFSCEVKFDEDLREYIDDVASRSPLDFTITGSEQIDGYDSINMEFSVSDKTSTYTITNNEDVDIKLDSFSGIIGDFTIDAFSAFTFSKGDSFTFDVTYNYTSNIRVSKEVKFIDIGGRSYTFYLWATSNPQPVAIYNVDDEKITKYDLENHSDYRNQIIKIKNEGLEVLTLNAIDSPSGAISIDYLSNTVLEINEVYEVTLRYTDLSSVLIDEPMVIHTDDPRTSTYNLPLTAGGVLKVDLLDNSSNVIPGSVYFGISNGTPISLDFYLDNVSLGDIELSVSLDRTVFNSDIFERYTLTPDANIGFQVSFTPTSTSVNNTELILMDTTTERTKTFQFLGDYTP